MSNFEDRITFVERKKFYSVQSLDSEKTPAGVVLEQFAAAFEQSPKPVILSLAGIGTLTPSLSELLDHLKTLVQAKGKLLRLVFHDAEFNAALKEFELHDDLAGALGHFAVGKKSDERMHYLKSFVVSAVSTLSKLQGLSCKKKAITLLKTGEKLVGDYSGILQVQYEGTHYCPVISFPEQTLPGLIQALGGGPETDADALDDLASSLFNRIADATHRSLPENQGSLNTTSEPVIVRGKSISKSTFALRQIERFFDTCKVIVVEFESSAGPIFIQICFPPDFTAAELRLQT